MKILDDSEAAETFTVLDWNILCDKYATPTLYKYTAARALEWEYRRDLIMSEIKNHEADFLCLQEVDIKQYEEFFTIDLSKKGYEGVYWPKSRYKTMNDTDRRQVDGCATFYKADK